MRNTRKNKKQKNTIVEILGWYGVVATLIAYAGVSAYFFSPHSIVYQALNLTGALGITIETYYHRDFQPFWLNLIWAGIAFVAILGIVVSYR